MWVKVFTALFLGVLSSHVYASDFSGFFSVMYLIIIVGFSTAINIGLIITFYASGKYQDISFVKKHTGIAITIPLIGMLLAVGDHRSDQDLIYCLGFNTLAAAIALIPVFIRRYVYSSEALRDVSSEVNGELETGQSEAVETQTVENQEETPNSASDLGSKMLVVSAVLALCSALLLSPLVLGAIYSGHIAMNNNQGQKRSLSIMLLVLSYAYVTYWFWTMISAFY